jgi:MauM/NapG family ferredoxin protein
MGSSSKILIRIRRLTQVVSVFLLIYIIWLTRYPLSGFINPRFYFMADPLVMYVTAVAERVFLPGLIYSTILVILTLILGRGFCGFVCPLGAIQDFLGIARSGVVRIFRKKTRETEPLVWRHFKFIILFVLVAAALFGMQVAWFFDPLAIFVRSFAFNVHPFVNRIVDSAVSGLSAAAGYPDILESIYDWLHESFLSLSTPVFPHTNVILIILVAVLILSLVKRRFWCRYCCPLGGLLALPARRPLLRRDVNACRVNCGACKNLCRMNAIRSDNTYLPGECILCFDCTALCPTESSTFSFKKPLSKTDEKEARGIPISRARFISMSAGVIVSSLGIIPWANAAERSRAPRPGTASRLRPPGALPEAEFVQRCIRCGNCMKVCPTNVLTPSPIGLGLDGAWSPILDLRRGYCEYECNLCGRVCPTGAIRSLPLTKKKKTKIGLAVFDKKTCLPYAKAQNCIVCEEHCPVPEKAIKLTKKNIKGKIVKQPVMNDELCIGCGICELKCPTSPDKGIIVVRKKSGTSLLL